ncbi:MAG: NAD(P)/FAD-dependent oxidoreductase [Chitinophagales bacterium]
MAEYDIIIVGAGAAGLYAARELQKTGKKILVLEAQNRIGGRIHSVHSPFVGEPLEAGAEFIHGNLPITLELLKQYSIPYQEVDGTMWTVKDSELHKEDDFIESDRQLRQALKELKEDVSVEDFLNTYMQGEEHKEVRDSVKQFVEGYGAANADKASTIAFRKDWTNINETQYRILTGYGSLIQAIAMDLYQYKTEIKLNEKVKEVIWEESKVTLVSDKEKYVSKMAIITIPLSLLQLSGIAPTAINFKPQLTEHVDAAKQIGYGSVVKVLIAFKTPFWQNKELIPAVEENLEKLSFIFADTPIPTWWTQYPAESGLLTGWIGGPKADAFREMADNMIYEMGIRCLGIIFKIQDQQLKELVKDWRVFNWGNSSYTKGAYSYATVNTHNQRALLATPVANTLFFAGEACYDGENIGTVEAAFDSAQKAVKLITTVLK